MSSKNRIRSGLVENFRDNGTPLARPSNGPLQKNFSCLRTFLFQREGEAPAEPLSRCVYQLQANPKTCQSLNSNVEHLACASSIGAARFSRSLQFRGGDFLMANMTATSCVYSILAGIHVECLVKLKFNRTSMASHYDSVPTENRLRTFISSHGGRHSPPRCARVSRPRTGDRPQVSSFS
jgi:hypothetical protein